MRPRLPTHRSYLPRHQDVGQFVHRELDTSLGAAICERRRDSPGLLLHSHVHHPWFRRFHAVCVPFVSPRPSTHRPCSNGLNILPSYTDYFHLTAATTGLQTASVFIGGVIAGLTWGFVTDWLGRRVALFWAAIITIVAVVLQTAAQDNAMFIIARILIGFGTTASGCSGPPFLAETLPLHQRGYGIGLFNDCYYVGKPWQRARGCFAEH